MSEERPIVFDCAGDRLVGMLHPGAPGSTMGIVIVVGGPQYRVGSHRQFVLMARRFAAAGVPVLRFDVRGMGDSEGGFQSFEKLDPDIRASIDAFVASVTSLSEVILLGLCDAASANLIYAHTDDRVRGLILINPWARTPQGEAKAYLRHYYGQRLFQKSFWRKVFSGELGLRRAASDFFGSIKASRSSAFATGGAASESYLDRMLAGWRRFRHPVLLVLSGRDLTAQEFVHRCRVDVQWRGLLDGLNCSVNEYPEADHTISDRTALEAISGHCLEWVREMG